MKTMKLKFLICVMTLAFSFMSNAQGVIQNPHKAASTKQTKKKSSQYQQKTKRRSNPNIISKTFEVNGVAFEMILVEGGSFMMGSDKKSNNPFLDGYPSHQETVTDFYIGKFVVTEKLWDAVLGQTDNSRGGRGLNYPKECSWQDAMAFVNKLNEITGQKFRLPSEKEWEFAAKGGNYSNNFIYSGSNSLGEVGWKGGEDYHPVGLKKANELGLFDMSGNIFEWVDDKVGSGSRIMKGGAWNFYSDYCKPSSRFSWRENGIYYVGLRLAM